MIPAGKLQEDGTLENPIQLGAEGASRTVKLSGKRTKITFFL